MNIVLATHDSVYGRYLAATLHAAARLDGIVVETARAPSRFYWKKLKRVGPVDFAFQALLNRWFAREGARHLPNLAMPAHTRVRDINAHPFGANDLVIGFGSSYVTPQTLARMPQRMLNLHTGWLPDYRGVKSEFWTLYGGDHERVGWTLHHMAARLDQGDIVLRRKVPWTGENPAALRAKLLRDAVEALTTLIARIRVLGPVALTGESQGEGRYYTTPTWAAWREYRSRANRLP